MGALWKRHLWPCFGLQCCQRWDIKAALMLGTTTFNFWRSLLVWRMVTFSLMEQCHFRRVPPSTASQRMCWVQGNATPCRISWKGLVILSLETLLKTFFSEIWEGGDVYGVWLQATAAHGLCTPHPQQHTFTDKGRSRKEICLSMLVFGGCSRCPSLKAMAPLKKQPLSHQLWPIAALFLGKLQGRIEDALEERENINMTF